MASFTVTTLDDAADTGATPGAAGDGLSLREAIRLASETAGDDTIEFAAGLSGQTSTLGANVGGGVSVTLIGVTSLTDVTVI